MLWSSPRQRLSVKYARSSIHVAVSIAAVGSVSFMVLAVGARTIDEEAMATFVKSWVSVNTVAIAFGSAFDQLGPRLVARDRSLAGRVLLHAIAVPSAGAVITAVATTVIGSSLRNLIALSLYAVSVSVWNGARSFML